MEIISERIKHYSPDWSKRVINGEPTENENDEV